MIRRTRSAILFTIALLTGLGLAVTSASPSSAQINPDNGTVAALGWTFSYGITDLFDGIVLENVAYNGNQVLSRASVPVMNVFYENDACGPYADRMGNGNEPVTAREITYGGERWIEIGIEDRIGSYVMYQVWYLSENGVIDAHMFSKGLQCRTYHEHIPFWRLDFDIDGPANDQIVRRTASGFVTEDVEFSRPATDAIDHGWQVRDTVTGSSVAINFDDGTWNVPGSVVPETDYARNRVYGRAFNPTEAEWVGGPTRRYNPGDEDEDINDADVVLWYTGWMPHTPDEGESLWHSTGVRMTVNGRDVPGPTPTPPAATPAPTATPRPGGPSNPGQFANHQAPGSIEAEDFDTGGEFVSYRDTDGEFGTARSYRDSKVDIWNTIGADGYTVGRTRDGEWLEYSVRFTEADRYRFDLRVASGHENPGAIEVTIDGNRLGQVTVNPHGWWNFRNLSAGTANINPALHKIRLTWKDGAQINLDRLIISKHVIPPDVPFGCNNDNGVLTWTDHLQPKYWVYKSVDGGNTFRWIGRALNSATFTDPSPTDGAVYQVHYQGIPRSICTVSD